MDVIHRASIAIIVTQRDGQVMYASANTANLLESHAEIAVISGRLVARDSSIAERLDALIKSNVDKSEVDEVVEGVVTIPGSSDCGLNILVAPFRSVLGPNLQPPAAIMFLRESNIRVAPSTAIRGLFNLTPAESAIASRLTRGMALDDIAKDRNISIGTVRMHMKRIFGKTGTRRQAELVAVLFSSVATLMSVR